MSPIHDYLTLWVTVEPMITSFLENPHVETYTLLQRRFVLLQKQREKIPLHLMKIYPKPFTREADQKYIKELRIINKYLKNEKKNLKLFFIFTSN